MNRRTSASLLRVALVLAALALAGCAASTLPHVTSDAERLEAARRLAKDREWLAAIDALKTYIERNAGSASVDEAIYLLGDCYLRSKDYTNAVVEFERLQRDYPESDSSAAGAFRLGEALFGQSRPVDFDQDFTVRALSQWVSYRRDYPGHWLNDEADRRIAMCRARLATKLINTAELYLKLREFKAARVYFRRVEQEFSDTPLLGDALLGLARCEALEWKYDEALAILRDIEERFAGAPLGVHAGRERARIERMKKLKPPRQAQRLPDSP
jgi:outer membrane protein assembly factor BamD